MKKKHLIALFISLLLLTIVLIVIGMIFNKTENEKQNGLSNYYDVSTQNTIAYVTYANGKPQLFIYNEKQDLDSIAVEYDENTMILDPSFSSDGSTLAYITTNKDQEVEQMSKVHFLNLRTKEISEVFTDESTITEVEFKPDGSSLLYLRAGTFQNYSPIASERPHEFDLYEFSLDTLEHEQKTALRHYSIHSLQVAPSGEKVFLTMDDDSGVETAEDSFSVKNRIFEVPLDNPNDKKVISDPESEIDMYSFALAPKGDEIIYQAVSNPDEGATYEYELFNYHLDSKEVRQLTHLGKHASDPVISNDGKTIYFMVDMNFAQGDAENHLYRMSINGNQIEEIHLPAAK